MIIAGDYLVEGSGGVISILRSGEHYVQSNHERKGREAISRAA
jgi:hypothetical protein